MHGPDGSLVPVTRPDGSPRQPGDTLTVDSAGYWRAIPTVSPPSLTALEDDVIDIAGGDTIIAYGTKLAGATALEISTDGGSSWTPATITANIDTYVSATSPALTAASGLLRVKTPYGTSNTLTIKVVDNPAKLSTAGFWPDTWNASAKTTAHRVPGTLGDYMTAAAYSGWALVKIDDITTNDSTTNGRINNDVIIGGASGYFAIYLRSNGGSPVVGITHFPSGSYASAEIAITLGQWNFVHWRFNGTQIQIGVNGTWSTAVSAGGNLAAAGLTQVVYTMRGLAGRAGDNDPSGYTKGRIRELGLSKTNLTDTQFANIKSKWIDIKYGFPSGVEAPIAGAPFAPVSTPTGGTFTATTLLTGAPWTAPSGNQDGSRLDYYKGRWRLLFGWNAIENSKNTVYSAADIAGTWVLDLANNPSPPTTGPSARPSPRHVFGYADIGDGYRYVFGGDLSSPTGGTAVAPWQPCDLWRWDGTLFERIDDNVPWNGNALYIGGAYKGEIHVLCGVRDFGRRIRCEHWKGKITGLSVKWTRLPDPPFARFAVMKAVEHDGYLVVISGGTTSLSAPVPVNSTWAYNGTTWALQSASAPWKGRMWVGAESYDGKLWVINGRSTEGGNLENADAWWSEDLGKTWTSIGTVPWAGSHADGIHATADGIFIASGYGVGTNVYRIKRAA